MKIEMLVSALAAALPCAAKGDTRYYLNGVYIEHRAGGCVRVVATDGHVLVSVADNTDTKQPTIEPFILPRSVVEWALKNSKAGQRVTITVEDKRATVATATGGSTTVDLVDGKYPDWCSVIPMGVLSGVDAHFGTEAMGKVVSVGVALKKFGAANKKGACLKMIGNGETNSSVFRWTDLSENMVVGGVVMPWRGSTEVDRGNITASLR